MRNPPTTKRHTEAVQHSSKDSNWRTPPALFAQLDQEFNFLLDAAATRDNKLCPHYFGPDHTNLASQNALAIPWDEYLRAQYETQNPLGRCAVFVNPPYSREQKQPIGPWIQKAWIESRRGVTVVGVIPYSPQTIWWRLWVEGHGAELKDFHAAREVRKIPHRVSFLRPDGSEESNAGGNTAVVVWKPNNGLVAPWVPLQVYWDYLSREACDPEGVM